MTEHDPSTSDTVTHLLQQRVLVLEQDRERLQEELARTKRAMESCVADLARARQQLGDTNMELRVIRENEARLERGQAVMEERTRLARELHDSVTQSLYSLVLHSGALARLLPPDAPEEARETVARLGRLAQDTLKEMRLLIFELRPAALVEEGLVAALRSRLEAVEARASVEVHLEAPEDVRLPPSVEEALYRIAQEALNNALKHAQATSVRVTLSTGKDSVYLAVRDNGQGFEPPAEHGTGLGLTSIRERVAELGGELRIDARPGQGTVVWVQLPLAQEHADAG